MSRISSAMRAIGAAFGKLQEPFAGLLKGPEPEPITPEQAREMRFWRDDDG